jgi:hypothetical protein
MQSIGRMKRIFFAEKAQIFYLSHPFHPSNRLHPNSKISKGKCQLFENRKYWFEIDS